MIPEQLDVLNTANAMVEQFQQQGEYHPGNHNVIFLDAFAGTGKTVVLNSLLDAVRATGKIALGVASSGIAANLLYDGKTAHSRLRIPIPCFEDDMCAIKKTNCPFAQLIRSTQLLVWDEAPMQNRLVFSAVSRTFKDIMSCDKMFGGIPIVLGGDLSQILPVIPKGSRAQIVDSCIINMPEWNHVKIMRLTFNHRVHQAFKRVGQSASDAQEYVEWLQSVGRGTAPTFLKRGDNVIQLKDKSIYKGPSLNGFLDDVYPNLAAHTDDKRFLANRAILTPLVVDVDKLNEMVIEMWPAANHVPFVSADSCLDDHGKKPYSTDLLNLLCPSGVAPHKLVLKIGSPIMLLRNLNKRRGACNGTRLIIRELTRLCIVAEIMSGKCAGNYIDIPRVNMSPSDTTYGVKFKRRQFPVRLAFTMTVNKAQGQTLTRAGVYLPQPVFTHGQLYVALSRAGLPEDLSIYILDTGDGSHVTDDTGSFTRNIVYHEVFMPESVPGQNASASANP